jgi:hypothetical protein
VGGEVAKSSMLVSLSLTVNWLNQRSVPSSSDLKSFLTSHGSNVAAGYWAGVTESYTPGLATGGRRRAPRRQAAVRPEAIASA